MNRGPVSTRHGAAVDDSWKWVDCSNGVNGLQGELSHFLQEFLQVTAKLDATQQELQDLKVATQVTAIEVTAPAATEEAAALVAQRVKAVLSAEVTSYQQRLQQHFSNSGVSKETLSSVMSQEVCCVRCLYCASRVSRRSRCKMLPEKPRGEAQVTNCSRPIDVHLTTSWEPSTILVLQLKDAFHPPATATERTVETTTTACRDGQKWPRWTETMETGRNVGDVHKQRRRAQTAETSTNGGGREKRGRRAETAEAGRNGRNGQKRRRRAETAEWAETTETGRNGGDRQRRAKTSGDGQRPSETTDIALVNDRSWVSN